MRILTGLMLFAQFAGAQSYIFRSNIVPGTGNTYDIGTSALIWDSAYINAITTLTLRSPSTVIQFTDGIISLGTAIAEQQLYKNPNTTGTHAVILPFRDAYEDTLLCQNDTAALIASKLYISANYQAHTPTANIIPAVDSTYDLGAYNKRWDSVYSRTARIGNGKDTCLQVASDGTLTLHGNATAWDDVSVNLIAAKSGVSDKPAYVADSGAFMFTTNDSTGTSSKEILSGSFEIPHNWKDGSGLDPHLHVIQTGTADTAYYVLKWKWQSLGSQTRSTWKHTLLKNRAFAYSSGQLHQLIYGNLMDGTGTYLSSVIIFELHRLSPASGNSYVYNLGFHYQIDSFGSSQEYIK